MNIENNSVGNYSPVIKRNQSLINKSTGQIPEKIKDEAKLSPDEMKYFANLDPENAKEIMDYHFYEKNGKMSGVKLGSNFDKRG
jgi:hypothetical protein